ncbi:MAG: TonB-dependent receptor, partial [Bryobacteraceae bacterium]
KLTSFVRLSQRKLNIFNEPTIPGPSGGDSNGFTRVLNQSLATGATYTLSPTSLIEFRLGISRTRAGKEPTLLGGASLRALYGIPGLPETPNLTGGLTAQDIGGYSRIGRQPTNPQWQHPTVVNPKVNFTKVMGRHTFKSGYEYQRVNTEVQDVNPLYGADGYAGAFSRPTGGTASNTIYNTADFLFGARSSYSLANLLIAQYRQRMHFGYVQDDFKLTPKLTMNIGMRYEFATPQWEQNNQLSNFDPKTLSIISAKPGSLYDRALVDPDKNNFAPRLGMAYALSSKTAIRSGYGISYIHFNRVGGGNILAINGPQVVIGTISQDPSRAGFLTTQQGYPAGLTDPKTFDPLKAIVKYLPRDTRTAYVQNWHLTIQHELVKDLVIDLGYIGNHGLKYLNFIDYNQARTNNPGEALSVQARRSITNFATISAGLPVGFSTYHALQFKIERRMQRGLYLLNSFTWSKAIDNAALALESEATGQASNPQDGRNLAAEKGLSGYNQPLTNVTSVVWEVPFGRGRRFGSGVHPAADALIGGWQLTGINSAWSGEPINLRFASPSPAFQVTDNIGTRWLGGTSQRPNIIGDPYTPEAQRTTANYFNAATVVLPTDPSRPFGNAGRNIVRANAVYQLDLGIYKDFRIKERTRLQFRTEMFNALNKTNFFPAEGNRSAAAFGSITQTFPARQIQFALKLYW